MSAVVMAEMLMSLLLLRKYGDPPDLQETAVQTVLQQGEALSSGWSLRAIVKSGVHEVDQAAA